MVNDMKTLKAFLAVILICGLLAGCAAEQADPLSLGEQSLFAHDYEQALEQFGQAIELEPENPQGYAGAAQALIALGRGDEAIEILRQGIRLINDAPELMALLREVYVAELVRAAAEREQEQPAPAPTPAPEPELPISDYGREAATEFLSGFTSIFQPRRGLRDSRTGNFYAFDSEARQWVEAGSLPPEEIPLVFQGGVTDGVPDNWFSDSWGAFFDGKNFYDRSGNTITDALFMHPARSPQIEYSLAFSFQLFDFDGDGIPEIVVEFLSMGVIDGGWDGRWGTASFGPFVLYRYIDGTYREMGEIPALGRGSSGFAELIITVNEYGELFAESGHDAAWWYTYNIKFTNGGMELVRVEEAGLLSGFTRARRAVNLEREITESLAERAREYAAAAPVPSS